MDGSWWTLSQYFPNLSHRHVPFILQPCVAPCPNTCGLLSEAAVRPQSQTSRTQEERVLCLTERTRPHAPSPLQMVFH